jgi:hypothetical protein
MHSSLKNTRFVVVLELIHKTELFLILKDGCQLNSLLSWLLGSPSLDIQHFDLWQLFAQVIAFEAQFAADLIANVWLFII